MYEGLESNLPHMLMQFSDTPFPTGTQLFPRRETVMQYLRDYAGEIVSMIKFDHQVMDVQLKSGDEWEVTTRAAGERINRVDRFDAVIAANGHCDWPILPGIEGLDAWSEQFPDSLYHSVSYKNPKIFKNKVSKHLTCLSFHLSSHNFTDKVTNPLLACPTCRRRPLGSRHQPSDC